MISVALICCDEKPDVDDGYVIPGGGDNKAKKISIAELKTYYTGSPRVISDEVYIEGRVVSSDRCGNFPNSMVVEDLTGGVTVNIRLTNYFEHFPLGSHVTVSLNSLTIDSNGGTITVNKSDVLSNSGSQIELVRSYININTASWLQPEPNLITAGDLSARYVSCFVRFDEVQFIEEEKGLAWCDSNLWYTERHLVTRSGDTIIVRNSNDVIFSSYKIPEGSGSIDGILDYNYGNYRLVLVDEYDVFFNKSRF